VCVCMRSERACVYTGGVYAGGVRACVCVRRAHVQLIKS